MKRHWIVAIVACLVAVAAGWVYFARRQPPVRPVRVLLCQFANLAQRDTREDISDLGRQVLTSLAIRLADDRGLGMVPVACTPSATPEPCDLIVTGTYTAVSPSTVACSARVCDASGRLLDDLSLQGPRSSPEIMCDRVALALSEAIERSRGRIRAAGADIRVARAFQRAIHAVLNEDEISNQGEPNPLKDLVRVLPDEAERLRSILAWRRGDGAEAVVGLASLATRVTDREFGTWCVAAALDGTAAGPGGAGERKLVRAATRLLPEWPVVWDLAARVRLMEPTLALETAVLSDLGHVVLEDHMLARHLTLYSRAARARDEACAAAAAAYLWGPDTEAQAQVKELGIMPPEPRSTAGQAALARTAQGSQSPVVRAALHWHIGNRERALALLQRVARERSEDCGAEAAIAQLLSEMAAGA